MSFTALLLPLRPHLTYYQYLAEKKKKSVQSFPPSGSSCGNPTPKYGASSKTLARPGEQGLPASRTPPHSPAAALRSTQTRPTILGSTHIPRSGLAALPASTPQPPGCPLPSLLRLTSQSPQWAHTHSPTWAGSGAPRRRAPPCAPQPAPAQMRSACSSASPPAQPGGATQGGTARSP